jgi:hypothetical protein
MGDTSDLFHGVLNAYLSFAICVYFIFDVNMHMMLILYLMIL